MFLFIPRFRGAIAVSVFTLCVIAGNPAKAKAQDIGSQAGAWLVGDWQANQYEGDFRLSFTNDSKYHYKFFRKAKLIAEHTGTYTIRTSNEDHEQWPALDSLLGSMRRGRGLVIRFQPTAIRKATEAGESYLLGDSPAEFRLGFRRFSESDLRFRLLHVDQGPLKEDGLLRFTKGLRP